MTLRTLIVSIVLALVAATIYVFSGIPSTSGNSGATGNSGTTAKSGPDGITSGCGGRAAIATAYRGRIIVDNGCGRTQTFQGATGMLRDPVTGPNGVLAYVDDLKGADTLTAVVGGKRVTVPTHGEVQNPSWSAGGKLAWAEDLSRVSIWSPSGGRERIIRRPTGSASVFAPVFPTDTRIDAVVQEPGPGLDAQEDGLNNLYSYDLRTERWRKLTSFRVTGDGWSVIRTPVRSGNSIYFVRVYGHASATGRPNFELWKLRGKRAVEVRSLPYETYLAGAQDNELLFSARSRSCKGEWGLFTSASGSLDQIGCGSALADPFTGIDPDLASSGGKHRRDTGNHRATHPSQAVRDLVVVIGDFKTSGAAEKQAAHVPDRYYATVINHAAAPEAVGPGAWIVAVRSPAGTSARSTLANIKGSLRSDRVRAYLSIVKGMAPGD